MRMRWWDCRTNGPRRGLLVTGLLAACLAWVPGCDEDCVTDGCASPRPAGVIRGRVDVGPMAFAGSVYIEELGLPGSAGFQECAPIEADGSYSLTVPFGSYALAIGMSDGATGYSGVLYVRSGNRWGPGYSAPDTLVLDAEQPVLALEDLALGSLEVTLSVPEGLEGSGVALLPEHAALVQGGPYWHWPYLLAEVAGGVAHFEIPAFLPGVCRLRFSVDSGSYSQYFYYPGTLDREEADSLRVEARAVTRCSMDLSALSARLSGSVRGSWQLLDRRRPRVTLVTIDSILVASEGCSANGEFDLGMLCPEPVKLLLDIDGIQRWVGGVSFAQAEVFDLAPGSDLTFGELTENGLFVHLDLPDPLTESALRLVFHDAASLAPVLTTPVQTRGDARLVCSNLPAGTYRIRIDNPYLASPAVSQWFDRAGDIESATVVTIPDGGQVAEIWATLEPGGELAGDVAVPGGDPYPSVVVYITDAQTGACVGRTGDMRPGRGVPRANPYPYRARGLAAGAYKIGAVTQGDDYCEDPPPETFWFPGTPDWEAAGTIVLADQAVVTGIDFSLPE